MQALRCEVSSADFWELTPYETYLAIDAWIWRSEQHQRQQIVLAWRVAALTRAKKLPALSELLNKPARPLVGAELERRRSEFASMTASVDLSRINKAASQQQQRPTR